MDSLTHIALGACMGEAFAGRTVGRKALLWGALAQSLPDIDFIAGFYLNTTDNLLAHRGFTHSILFAIVITPLLAFTAEYFHRPHNISLKRWMAFFGAVIFGHIFFDAFNNYGVAWFEPFWHHRFSFNAIYVVDPFFSIAVGISCIALGVLPRFSIRRRFWWRFGLAATAVYMGYTVINKFKINYDVKKALAEQGIQYKTYFTTPAPLQNWLWFVVAGDEKGFYVGYHSVYDRDKKISLNYFPRNEQLLVPYKGNRDLMNLKRFSQGFYTAEMYHDTLVFNDLRFGQEVGWYDPAGKFAFHYYLLQAGANDLVVQRGRFARWTPAVAKSLFYRIAGY